MRTLTRFLIVATLAITVAACAASNTEKGAVIGAGGGAVAGGVIGNQAGNTAVGAILGAVVGGAIGAAIGDYMDDQAEELERDLEGAEIERVGEGIKITFNDGLLFPVDESALTSSAQGELTDLAVILKKYEDTNILIEGHTDATGTPDYNLDLSDERAQSVAHYLAGQGVANGRMSTEGYGETQPIASNDTESGRRQNRRVEVAIWANEELKEAAEKKAGS